MKKKMLSYNMYEAKTNLSKLVEQVNEGNEVILMNRGEPIAKIVPLDSKKKRNFGFAKDIKIKPGFDEIPEGFEDYT